MYPGDRSIASQSFEVRLSSSNRLRWLLLAVLWIAAAMFLLAAT